MDNVTTVSTFDALLQHLHSVVGSEEFLRKTECDGAAVMLGARKRVRRYYKESFSLELHSIVPTTDLNDVVTKARTY